MESLFTALTQAVTGTPLIALSAALAWGVLSVVLSPCHLASIPLIIGFIGDQGQMPPRRALVVSILFAVGILITIALIGVVTAAAGGMMGDLGNWGNWLVALIFFLFGLHLLDLLPAPWVAPERVGVARKGLVAAFVLGLIFGVALGPCTFAFMAPMLGVVFNAAGRDMAFGASLLLAYGAGHCAVIVFAGTFTEMIQRFLDWNENSQGTVIVKRICGLLVIAGGVWLIHTAPM